MPACSLDCARQFTLLVLLVVGQLLCQLLAWCWHVSVVVAVLWRVCLVSDGMGSCVFVCVSVSGFGFDQFFDGRFAV